ncbi:hypothetical protein [Niabella hibiscisoli]|uniref:hypothetical protein n=1 Tax=Niabella hibiscisoli TaxID=1825928 RepID=UPI001F0D9F7E|nr:hypothetical protein [Niabella hibiscisoli]MCH5714765.1 hypothetical protein [Niabella hibiscisoli]
MKKIIAVISLCLGSYWLRAQDLIYTKKEGVLQTKVIEITSSLIRFKKFENINGPNYSIANRYVDSIRYENGSKELFSFTGKRLAEKYIKELEQFSGLPNNLVSTGFELSSFNLPNIFSSNNEDQTPFAGWYIAYERLFAKQKLGISISPFAAWNRRYYGVSATAQFYTKNKGRTRVGIGPMLSYSVQDRVFYYYQTNANSGGGSIRMRTKTHITSLAINLSIMSNISRKIFIDGDMFIGPILKEKAFRNNLPDYWTTYVRKNEEPMMGFRLGVGYRF